MNKFYIDKEKIHKLLEECIDVILVLLWALIIANVITKYAFIVARVPSGSMEPTVMTDSKIILNKVTYKLIREPERFDIIVFENDEISKELNGDFFLKRIIGLPGETIEGKNYHIYINGELLEEPFVQISVFDDFGPYTIPENQYFVLGDNRLNSYDSRYWRYKYVKREQIDGIVNTVIYPKFKNIKYKGDNK